MCPGIGDRVTHGAVLERVQRDSRSGDGCAGGVDDVAGHLGEAVERALSVLDL